jgi:hypothetical protein
MLQFAALELVIHELQQKVAKVLWWGCKNSSPPKKKRGGESYWHNE